MYVGMVEILPVVTLFNIPEKLLQSVLVNLKGVYEIQILEHVGTQGRNGLAASFLAVF